MASSRRGWSALVVFLSCISPACSSNEALAGWSGVSPNSWLYRNTTGDCRKDWGPPMNVPQGKYVRWPYCDPRRPVPSEWPYMNEVLPPLQGEPVHQCAAGTVLRHDARTLICTWYEKGEDWATDCRDEICCAQQLCDTHACSPGWTHRNAGYSCRFGCTDELCCNPPAGVPLHDPQGMVFVDKDPGRYSYGGNATIIRALDESDITHYRVYWGFAVAQRAAPGCGGNANPTHWRKYKFRPDDVSPSPYLLKEVAATGCDVTFEIPMGTKPVTRCPISLDDNIRETSAVDPCNPSYFFIVSVNAQGERSALTGDLSFQEQLGPRHVISDYEGDYGMPCAEGGVTSGHDLPGPNDVVLGTWGDCATPKECARRCRAYRGAGGPCRQWTWCRATKGRSAQTCWSETQTVIKTHHTSRIQGPAVCPTADSASPAGDERPRCDRWVRIANTAPFVDAGWPHRKEYLKSGNAQAPALPHMPLGPYPNAESCQELCSLDALCVGFVWRKRGAAANGDPSWAHDPHFRRCIIIHVDTGKRLETQNFDMWLCSRATLPPILLGYDFKKHANGHTRCTGSPSAQVTVANHDCCAAACDSDANCRGFTFWHKERACELYTSCAVHALSDVDGCAAEGCFLSGGGHGASTYVKHVRRRLEWVDRWPHTGGEGELIARVQTNGGLEGAEVVCQAQRVGAFVEARPPLETTAGAMKAASTLEGIRVSGVVQDGIVGLRIRKERTSHGPVDIVYAAAYRVRCDVVDVDVEKVDVEVTTPDVPGYWHVQTLETTARDGVCSRRNSETCAVQSESAGAQETLLACSQKCDEHGSCDAFWYREDTKACELMHKDACGPFDAVSASDDFPVQCFSRLPTRAALETEEHVGSQQCEKQCGGGGSCSVKRRLGLYDRNVFIPPRDALRCNGSGGAFPPLPLSPDDDDAAATTDIAVAIPVIVGVIILVGGAATVAWCVVQRGFQDPPPPPAKETQQTAAETPAVAESAAPNPVSPTHSHSTRSPRSSRYSPQGETGRVIDVQPATQTPAQ